MGGLELVNRFFVPLYAISIKHTHLDKKKNVKILYLYSFFSDWELKCKI